MSERIVDQARAKFGDRQIEEYMALVKATRSLMAIWAMYVKAPTGSMQEHIIGIELTRMMSELEAHPDHAAAMIESLLAIIMHLRMGGTYEQWFESFGISSVPTKEEQ